MNFFETIIAWTIDLISRFGYGGIFFTMMLESAAIPIPSEVVLPFSGYLVSTGRLSLVAVVLVATLANLLGSLLLFFIGYYGGRPFLEKYGRYFLIHQDEITKINQWLLRHGTKVIFFSRLLPGIRTFSSLVIGAGKIKLDKFFLYTFLGSLAWNLPLTYVGFIAGQHWSFLGPYFQKANFAIGALLALGAVFFVFHHIRKMRHSRSK